MLALALCASSSGAAQDAPRTGLVVEAVEEGSAGEQAGLHAGDVLTSWRRAADPPANRQAAEGRLTSPFELLDVEVEQAARGPVTLRGTRRGQAFALAVPQGKWRITARPPMPPSSVELHTKARTASTRGDSDGAVLAWRKAAEAAATEGSVTAAVWLLL